MRYCPECIRFYRADLPQCQECQGLLQEVSLDEALKLTRQDSFRKRITGHDQGRLSDAYKQYNIRSYLRNRSLFLDYDLQKNRLKHGRRLKRFFIAPVNITSVLNLPWFLFNVINTNLFHLQHVAYCPRCETKFIPGQHTRDECDYNIEYFNILDDILSGRIVVTRELYLHYAAEKHARRQRSAYDDLFRRNVRGEVFWDLVSIGSSVFFWIYVAVNISYPMFLTLLQKLQQLDNYEWTILSLR